jgi:hypothetical protein
MPSSQTQRCRRVSPSRLPEARAAEFRWSTRAPAAVLLAGRAAVASTTLKLTLQNALRVLAVPIGIGVGLWTALLTSQACYIFLSPRGNGTACPYPTAIPHADFALWSCALLGAAAAAVVLLISIAMPRLVRH